MNKGIGKMRNRLILFNITPGRGNTPSVESGMRPVWADVNMVGVVTQYNAQSAGKKVELSAVMWAKSYQNETHAEYNGIKYKVDSVGPAENDMKIKLILTRAM